jgi:hypothetical protein
MPSHEVDYEIIGDDIQIVEVELDPGETVIAEAGAMNYMDDGISFESKMGDGSKPNNGLMGKIMSAGKRALTGESIFMRSLLINGCISRVHKIQFPKLNSNCQTKNIMIRNYKKFLTIFAASSIIIITVRYQPNECNILKL